MWLGVVSLFPEMFDSIIDYGVSGRAVDKQLIKLNFWNPRDFAEDKHRTVDDRPFGGGPGMVMKVAPLLAAILAAKDAAEKEGLSPKVIYLSPQGSLLRQESVEGLSQLESIIFIAGRYEGIDERVITSLVDEEWSIGDYVLSGGELAAMVFIDSLARCIPGVLGHEESAKFDSFSSGNKGLLDCPHYTRPEEILGEKVPDVLLSGHHEKIKQWRLKQSIERTLNRRPDILHKLDLDEAALAILKSLQ